MNTTVDPKHVVRINGRRYHAAEQDGRTWSNEEEPIDDAQGPETPVVMLFHGGGGSSFEGLENSYSHASRWAEDAPNKLSTWGEYADGETFTSADYQGWILFHEGYLFLLRGRYSVKYTPNDTQDSTWVKADTEDFGATTSTFVVGGRPRVFKGVLYVPIVDSADDGNERFQYLAAVTSGADTWAQGPVGRTFRCFTVWRDQLRGADGHLVYSVSADPSDSGDWTPAAGSGYPVGDSTSRITDMAPWPGGLLLVGKEDGLWTFAEDLTTNNQLEDVQLVKDRNNFVGMSLSQGSMLCPHRTGLIEWWEGGYRHVGPEQEGFLESDKTPGWGRVRGIATYGKYTFWVANDAVNARATVGSFLPGKERPRLPHFHFADTSGTFEGVTLVSMDNEPREPVSPDTWSDDDAVGTLEWTDPGNAEENDDAFATAGDDGQTHYLKGLNPNPGVPTDATIVGVLVEVRRSVD